MRGSERAVYPIKKGQGDTKIITGYWYVTVILLQVTELLWNVLRCPCVIVESPTHCYTVYKGESEGRV